MKLTAESTVLDDKKIGDSFATLQVEADGIRTEVGTKVGNDEVISRINQTAESVKIQANKIQIDGVITAINDNTTTTIDGDKITTGTLSASAVDASSGTFDTANIPNLSANKIATDTINIARIPTTARNDTYITDIGSDGIRVHDSNTSSNSIVIDSTGMEIFKGGTTSGYSIAKYGDTARIGKSGIQRVEVRSDGVYIYNPSNAQTGYYGSFARIGNYGSNNIRLDSNGIKFNSSQDNVISSFGETIQVGKTGQKNIQITSTDLNVYDDDGTVPFQVSTANSSSSQVYKIAWYINASSSYNTSAYFKGNIVNNTVSVGVATSGVPTASNTIVLTNAGTQYTITVSGVKYTFTRYTGILIYKIENTNNAKRSCLVSFTQSYKETFVKENTHILDTRYETVSIEDVTGTSDSVTLYTYAGVAQLVLRVYHGSSSVSNGGLIYKGRLGGFVPIYDCYMAGQINGIYAVSGYIDSSGNVLVYNTSGGSRTINSSNLAHLSGTYILAQ